MKFTTTFILGLFFCPLLCNAEMGWILTFEKDFQPYREVHGEKGVKTGQMTTEEFRLYVTPAAVRSGSTIRKVNKPALVLWEDEKKYSIMLGSPITEEQVKKAAGNRFQKTGRKQRVAGYSCEILERKTSDNIGVEGKTMVSGEETICLAASLAPIFEISRQFGWSLTDGLSPWNLPPGMTGVSVESIRRTPSGMVVSTQRLKQAVYKNISNSVFEIPDGYTEKEFDMGKAFMKAFKAHKETSRNKFFMDRRALLYSIDNIVYLI